MAGTRSLNPWMRGLTWSMGPRDFPSSTVCEVFDVVATYDWWVAAPMLPSAIHYTSLLENWASLQMLYLFAAAS